MSISSNPRPVVVSALLLLATAFTGVAFATVHSSGGGKSAKRGGAGFAVGISAAAGCRAGGAVSDRPSRHADRSDRTPEGAEQPRSGPGKEPCRGRQPPGPRPAGHSPERRQGVDPAECPRGLSCRPHAARARPRTADADALPARPSGVPRTRGNRAARSGRHRPAGSTCASVSPASTILSTDRSRSGRAADRGC